MTDRCKTESDSPSLEAVPIADLTKARPREQKHLEPILTGRARTKYLFFVLVWFVLALFFWQWWLRPEHNIGTVRFLIVTSAVGWIFFLQAYFVLLFLNARRVVSKVEELADARVAMVVTKTPSEPFPLVKKTLEAMLAQNYPHDTWLADEDPSDETIAWCAAHGVQLSTRKGHADYHRAEWPRRTRCKEGNLAFFYDHYGYENYDIVSQLDADHVPSPSYLREMLKPFSDPKVGYVSAPSICGSNEGQSWAARARLYSEAMFHGALQAGYSGGWAPMCIGSHYAVRTKALKEVGGLGPELAEDHSTSMILNAHGWRGVHAVDAMALGDGPATFPDMATQEFQWARSLLTLFLRYTPRYFSGLTPRMRFQFVFSQLWYPAASGFMAVVYAMPIVAILFDIRFAAVTYPAFIGHSAPAGIALILLVWLIKRDGLFRPLHAKILSWEKILFAGAQWPWMFWGCVMAVRDRLTGGFVDFRITPKGDAVRPTLPVRVLVPYVALALGGLLPVLLVADVEVAAGFYILSLLNTVLYVALVLVIIYHHAKENGLRFSAHRGLNTTYAGIAGTLVALFTSAMWIRAPESVHALSIGLDAMNIVEPRYVVSGAGRTAGEIIYVFWWSGK